MSRARGASRGKSRGTAGRSRPRESRIPRESLIPRNEVWLLALLLLVYGADFFFDVRRRDAFSWMDPSQYFTTAAGLLNGSVSPEQITVPSIFPYLIQPFLSVGRSIPDALLVNLGAAVVLLGAILMLRRELGFDMPAFAIGLTVLSSPLLLGTSRELYIEFTLTAFAAWELAFWLGWVRRRSTPSLLLFCGLLGLGFLVKTTFPIFFVAPMLYELLRRAWARQWRDCGLVAWAAVLPLGLALPVQRVLFPGASEYLSTAGNTTLPIMRLIGPLGIASWNSITYYPSVLASTGLFLLTPFLLIPLWQLGRRRFPAPESRSSLWILAFWSVAPLLFLTFQEVKEPRHIAPCVVGWVLLIFAGVQTMSPGLRRRVAWGGVMAAAVAQYALVTLHVRPTPYFLDGPVGRERIEEAARSWSAGPAGPGRSVLGARYAHNVGLLGFDANVSLALAWSLFPAIVYDLGLDAMESRFESDEPMRQFEDLYSYAAFNLYNRRCGWPAYYRALPPAVVRECLDLIVARGCPAVELAREFPRHTVVTQFPSGGSTVVVLARDDASVPSLRAAYASAFLAANPGPPPAERNTVFLEWAMSCYYRSGLPSIATFRDLFPADFVPSGKSRRIYYYSGYEVVLGEFEQPYRQWIDAIGRAGS